MVTNKQKLDLIWKKMTEEEQWELLFRQFSGGMQWDRNGDVIVMMGSASLKRLIEYEDEMIAKYLGAKPQGLPVAESVSCGTNKTPSRKKSSIWVCIVAWMWVGFFYEKFRNRVRLLWGGRR